jgi:hypothetical protein
VSDDGSIFSFSGHVGMLSFQPLVTLLASRSQVQLCARLFIQIMRTCMIYLTIIHDKLMSLFSGSLDTCWCAGGLTQYVNIA